LGGGKICDVVLGRGAGNGRASGSRAEKERGRRNGFAGGEQLFEGRRGFPDGSGGGWRRVPSRTNRGITIGGDGSVAFGLF